MGQRVRADNPAEMPLENGLTAYLGDICVAMHDADLPLGVLRLARHCFLDWAAVTIAGAREPLSGIIGAALAPEAQGGVCSLAGAGRRCGASEAALINGTLGHALDFDDVNARMQGHPSVALMPAIMAIAEANGRSGGDALRAFVGGYQVASRLGAALGGSHYARGFHATATVGSVAAAAGCAILLRLDSEQTRIALALAATQAGGLKASFGTMAKPLHAGKAAANGVLAVRLAQHGFSARADTLEHGQGLGAAMSDDFQPERAASAAPEWEIEDNLFKYHASCYLTHSSIEALSRLVARDGISPEDVSGVRIHVPAGHRKVCDILHPRTGLDIKFSIRHLAALALYGENTAALPLYSEATANDPRYTALRSKVTVVDDPGQPGFGARVCVDMTDGRSCVAEHDVGAPVRDLDVQEKMLRQKAATLVTPILGAAAAEQLFAAVDALETAGSVADYMSLITAV